MNYNKPPMREREFEENKCKHRINGKCTRIACLYEVCSDMISYTKDNWNDMPCDGAGYEED